MIFLKYNNERRFHMDEIIELDIKNYEKCNNIWNMEKK